MTSARPDEDRNLIPRWRSPTATADEGELSPLRRLSEPPWDAKVELSEAETDWRRHQTMRFATDLVASALVVGSTPPAREAAQQVLLASEATPLAKLVARRVLEGETGVASSGVAESAQTEAHKQIHDLKRRLTDDPRNTVAWTELARHYTIDGKQEQAQRAMGIALALAPNHRYVLRAASRLAVHDGDFATAHRLVARAEATRIDPWLMATELATSEVAGRHPVSVRAGTRLLEAEQHSPRATSELAGAIATLELRGGRDKRARRLFQTGLTEPNENMVAHGEWASYRVSGLVIPKVQLEASWEARAHRRAENGDWAGALKASWGWLADQPFSSGPAELGSYQASLGHDFQAGAAIARAGLLANPREFLLTNNLAFCLIQMGDPEGAAKELSALRPAVLSEAERAIYCATTGLLAFRKGEVETGRELYRRSIAMSQDQRSKAIALIMLTAEELRVQSPYGDEMLPRARQAGSEQAPPDLALWLSYLPGTADHPG